MEARMRINGETKAQMDHCEKLLSKDPPTDHSVDQPWEIDDSLASTDKYVLTCTALYLLPKAIVFTIPLILAITPLVLLCKLLHLRSQRWACLRVARVIADGRARDGCRVRRGATWTRVLRCRPPRSWRHSTWSASL